jgi:hypothetical protein
MKRFTNIWVYAASALIGLALSYLVTIVGWNVVEHRALHCTDDIGFTFVSEDIDTHRGAGDTLLPGWTWAELKTARAIYQVAFLGLWFTIAASPRFTILRKNSHESVA